MWQKIQKGLHKIASEYVSDTLAVAITRLFAQWNCFEGNVANLLCYFVFIRNKVFPGKF
jgi:hypothetical protein